MALLAVRTLLIMLVVAAMAKPFLESLGNVIAGRRTHRVLVLDGSLSMGYTSGDKSRFDRAKDTGHPARQGSRQGDTISLITDGRSAPGGHRRPSPNRDRGSEGDRRADMPHGGTDLRPPSRRSIGCSTSRRSLRKKSSF